MPTPKLTPTPTPVALVLEDEREIRHFVRISLEAESWQVHEAGTVQQGLVEAGTRRPDLIIADLGLPDGDGVDFIRQVRNWSAVPIIVLSARTDESGKVAALDAGADDYITKPFGVNELLARTRASLRRMRVGQMPADAVFSFGDVEVDLAARVVRKRGAQVHLTPIEYRLLCLLVANAGRVLTHPHLLREVWGPTHAQSTHYLRVYMGNLRQKLEDDSAQPKFIVTETGVGYRLLAE
jgi:two-component system KDP operon response regulator KdpE